MKQAAFAFSFQGASHIRKEENVENGGKKFPCQDRAFSGDFAASEIAERKDLRLFVKDNSNLSTCVLLPVELKPHKAAFSLVCVADGHGSAPHFKSQKGAEFAIQTAVEMLSESIDKIIVSLQEKNYPKLNKNLSKSFVRRWIRKIIADFASFDSKDFSAQVQALKDSDEKIATLYQDDYEKAISLAKKYEDLTKNQGGAGETPAELSEICTDFSKLEIKSIYGCTFVAFFRVMDSPLWYAFKIGDSDLLVSFEGIFVKPIADDAQCHENVTTSLCNDTAAKNFCFPDEKYLEKLPETVFCSSDGVSDSFTDEEYLKKFYTQLQFSYDEDGPFHSDINIKETLPMLSKNGSGDDISLAGIVSYDDSYEAKQKRRKNALERAEKFWSEGNYSSIYLVFKPYIDKGDAKFKYSNAIYDYNETFRLFKSGLNKNFLAQWSRAYSNFTEIKNKALD